MKLIASIGLLSVLVFFTGKCSREKAEPICDLPAVISFSNDVQPIFSRHCALSGCHAGSNPEGGLSLESSVAYSELFTPGKGYIDTIHPKYSLLYSQMTNETAPMPPDGKLMPCSTKVVLKWIEQKAKNN